MTKISKSKRLWLSIAAFMRNFITFWIAMHKKINLVEVGTGLALLNTPIYAYIFHESWKPTPKEEPVNN